MDLITLTWCWRSLRFPFYIGYRHTIQLSLGWFAVFSLGYFLSSSPEQWTIRDHSYENVCCIVGVWQRTLYTGTHNSISYRSFCFFFFFLFWYSLFSYLLSPKRNHNQNHINETKCSETDCEWENMDVVSIMAVAISTMLCTKWCQTQPTGMKYIRAYISKPKESNHFHLHKSKIKYPHRASAFLKYCHVFLFFTLILFKLRLRAICRMW